MPTLDVDTTTYVTDAVTGSVIEAFEMMASEAAVPMEAGSDTTLDGKSEGMIVVVSLTGELQGAIGIWLSEDAAIRWTKDLIEHEATDLDQVVGDAAGELGNIIVGGAKRRLSDFDIKMGLPSVVKAGRTSVVFPTGIEHITVPFTFAGYELDVFVALKMA